MPGPFDFDTDEPPAPKKRRDDRDREDDEDDEADESRRRGYSPTSRRMPGRTSLSIGGFMMLAGGLIGLISMLLPAGGMFGQNVGVNEVVGTRVWLWSIGALAVGGGFLRVRTVRFPSAGDFLLVGFGVILALVFGGFQALAGYAIIDRTGLKGVGTYGLLLAGALTIFGGVLRCVEQVRRYGREDAERDTRARRGRDEDDEEPRPKPKAKPKPKEKPLDLPDD